MDDGHGGVYGIRWSVEGESGFFLSSFVRKQNVNPEFIYVFHVLLLILVSEEVVWTMVF